MKFPYGEVKLTKADTYRISNIYKVGNHYEVTVTIFQKFEGYSRGDMKKVYSDVTQKNIKVYILQENDFGYYPMVYNIQHSVLLSDIPLFLIRYLYTVDDIRVEIDQCFAVLVQSYSIIMS